MTLKSAARAVPFNPIGPLQGDPPADIPRDQWGRPLVIPFSQWRGSGVWHSPVGMTRASTLGGTLEDQYNLGQWRMGQVALGMGKRRDLQLAAATLTAAPADKQRRYDLAWKAFEAAESDAAASVGTSLHHLADRIDRGQDVPDVGEYNATLVAYRDVARYFSFSAIEIFVVNEELNSAGTADRLAELKDGWQLIAPDGTMFRAGDRLIWDLKTSSTADYFGIKFCVQFAVYAGGRPYQHLESRSIGRGKAIEIRGEYLDWPNGIAPSQKWGLICHAPSGQNTADLHWVPLEEGRDLADQANQVRADRKATWIVPAGLPVTSQLNELVPERTDALVVLIREVGSESELEMLWHQYGESTAWTIECDKVADEVITALSRPLHVRQLELLAAIKDAKDEDDITDLWGDHLDIWNDDCTRMAEAVLRNLPREDDLSTMAQPFEV